MQFELNATYEWVKQPPAHFGAKIGDRFVCHAIDGDGDCLTKDLTFKGIAARRSRGGGWCVSIHRLEQGQIKKVSL